MDDRIKRIEKYESILNEALESVEALDLALEDGLKMDHLIDRHLKLQDKIHDLEDYYSSPIYMEDLKADEEGLIPFDLPRGILSEDAIFNLLIDNDRILKEIKK